VSEILGKDYSMVILD